MTAAPNSLATSINGPISAEVIAEDAEGMIKEARIKAAWATNVNIKIPVTEAGLQAIAVLSKEGIRINMTLCFSANQALLGALAGATYVSPFVGRLDDIAHDGMELAGQILDIYENYGYDTEVIVASIRHPKHVLEAALMGADIATIPFKVIAQLAKHPLTDKGIALFLEDWKKVPKK